MATFPKSSLMNTLADDIILMYQARSGRGNHNFIRKHDSCQWNAEGILIAPAVRVAFVDKVMVNIQNYHSGISDIIQVMPCSYRPHAGVREEKNQFKLQIDC